MGWDMAKTTLIISSKNYSSWSLRGWLLARFAGIDFDECTVTPEDPAYRQELLLLAPSMLVPRLRHGGVEVWDVLAIGEFLHELRPKAGLLPSARAARAHCRSICGEMHAGFTNLRSSLPMNLRAHFPGFTVWSRALADIERITSIWNECLQRYGGPFLFGERRGMADAIYAPVATRFATYDVSLDAASETYKRTVLEMSEMREWTAAALAEKEEIDDLEVEF